MKRYDNRQIGSYYLAIIMSETSIKIKCGSPQLQSDPSQISLILHLQKQQIEKHYKQISQATKKYRVPLIVLEIPAQFKDFNFSFISRVIEQEIKFQITNGTNNKSYHLYEPNNLQLIAPLRKIQNLLQSINTLNNSFYINLTLSNFQDATKKTKDLAFNLFQNFILQGRIDLDKKLVNLVSQIVSKISPGFDESPFIAFLELFGGAQLDLQFESPSVLTNGTRESALPHQFKLKQLGEGKQDQALKLMLKNKEKMKVYVNIGKLGCIQLSAQVRVWALLECLI